MHIHALQLFPIVLLPPCNSRLFLDSLPLDSANKTTFINVAHMCYNNVKACVNNMLKSILIPFNLEITQSCLNVFGA